MLHMDSKGLKRPPQLFNIHTGLSARSANIFEHFLSNQSVRKLVSFLLVSQWNALGQFLQFKGLIRESGDLPSDMQTRKPSNIPQNNKVLTLFSSRKRVKECLGHPPGKAKCWLSVSLHC